MAATPRAHDARISLTGMGLLAGTCSCGGAAMLIEARTIYAPNPTTARRKVREWAAKHGVDEVKF